MTFEEKKEWLSRYRTNELEIQRLREEIIRWRSLAEKTTSCLSWAPAGGDGTSTLTKAVEMINEQEQKIFNKIVERMQLSSDIKQAIDTIENDNEKQVLLRRYIDCDSFEQIAVDMKYAYRWITELHKKGIENIQITYIHERVPSNSK